MQRVKCLGDHDGVLLSNGDVDLVTTTDVGPRVVEYRLRDGVNVLGEALEAVVETTLGRWRPYGGHRLWSAPEDNPRSYAPDNGAVDVDEAGPRSVRFTAAAEPGTGLRKSLTITLEESGSGVTIAHRIENVGAAPIELAPWALTIMREGGEALIPPEPFQAHAENLLPVRTLSLWGYTDLTDTRVTLGPRFIRVRSDTARTNPFKIGIANRQGWAGWHRDGLLFVKTFGYKAESRYPDLGANTEVFTAGDFIELESLGPLEHVAPGRHVEHIERWRLFSGIAIASADAELEATLDGLAR